MKRLALAMLMLASSSPAWAQKGASAAPVAVVALPTKSPLVTLALQFHAGAVDDPPGKAGLTALTARLMAEGGTQSLDSEQLRRTLFPMATEVRARVDKELTTFSVTVHKDFVAKMVGILGDVVARPRFDPSELTRLRDQTVNDVAKRLRQGDDENLGKAALEELMFRGHPYGRLTIGHVGDLEQLTMADVKQQAAHVFTRDRLTIGVAGGYPPDVVTQLQDAAATLPATGAPIVEVMAATPHRPRVRIVEKQTDSTAISIGVPWNITRHSPDYPALLVARSCFGEHRQMHGRLMQRLREMRGLNYGDYAYLEHFEQEGGDAVTAQTGRARKQGELTIWLRPVQNENALFALRAALYELQRSGGDEPFSAEEVERAKGFLDGYVLLYAQTDARRLGYALDDRALGGGKDLLATLRADIAKVTPADVQRVWKQVQALAPQMEIVMVTPKAAELKKAILTNAPSPMHYQKDAQGNVPKKPAALLAADKVIERLPIGVNGDADVEIIPVAKMFQ
ncbi:MAG TPA: pitrilysin family protein [Polyangia bacterium]|jgi:zinc protease|nr:pitrilysin family protein [Polyangia bacterium]